MSSSGSGSSGNYHENWMLSCAAALLSSIRHSLYCFGSSYGCQHAVAMFLLCHPHMFRMKLYVAVAYSSLSSWVLVCVYLYYPYDSGQYSVSALYS